MMIRRTSIALLALTLLVGCATQDQEADEPSQSSSYDPGETNLPDAGEPVDGGTLTFAAYSEPAVLDPAQTIVAGSTGGIEMAAVYDVLLRVDPESGETQPQLAESLEPNDDHTEWTLRLRPDVRFSDGSVLDADAVVWSIERYVADGGDEAMLWTDNVARTEVRDDRTVVFHLRRSWPGFDFLLTTGAGMIVGRASDRGGSFTPIGAGPFTLSAQREGEAIELAANDGYWGGRPHLDGVRTVFLGDPAAVQDSFDKGSVDLAFLRDPDLVDAELDRDTPGLLSLVGLGNTAVINADPGHPGEDPRLRKAMQLAIDPQLIADRAYGGAGLPGSEIFGDYSRWHTDVEALPFDPDEARSLVEAAKQDGFDGKLTYVDGSDKASRASSVAIEASLEAVGFDVEVKPARTIQEQITVVAVDRDYDLAGWAISWREAGPFGRMYATLDTQGNLSVGMPTGPEFDALLDEFQAAATEDEQREVMGRIQQEWNEQVPAVVFGPTAEFVTYGEDVRGVVPTTNSMVLLHDAWVRD